MNWLKPFFKMPDHYSIKKRVRKLLIALRHPKSIEKEFNYFFLFIKSIRKKLSKTNEKKPHVNINLVLRCVLNQNAAAKMQTNIYLPSEKMWNAAGVFTYIFFSLGLPLQRYFFINFFFFFLWLSLIELIATECL